MARVDFNSLIFNQMELDFGDMQITFLLKDEPICTARYKITKTDLQLNWIETQEEYQRQGVATKVMDIICDEALKRNMPLVVKVVNEIVLEFYHQWYLKRMEHSGADMAEVKKQFTRACVTDEDTDLILLTLAPADLLLKPLTPGTQDKSISTSFKP